METRTINLIVPRGWHELDNKQLRYLYGLLADDYTSAGRRNESVTGDSHRNTIRR